MYSKKDEEKKNMDAIIEYVREWNLESSKNGLERYIEEKAEENFVAGENKKSFDIAKNLLNLEISVDKIMKATGLTRKQILNLR